MPRAAGGAHEGATWPLKRQDIGAPSRYVQADLRLARQDCRSGAIVFLDGVVRQLLFPVEPGEVEVALRGLLELLQHDLPQQDAVLAALAGPGLLAQAGAPPALVDYLQSSLQGSWFSLDPSDGHLLATSTGTVPGTRPLMSSSSLCNLSS